MNKLTAFTVTLMLNFAMNEFAFAADDRANQLSRLAAVEKEAMELASSIQSGQTSAKEKEQLRKLVTQSFDLQTQQYQRRLEEASENLKTVGRQLAQRKQNAEQIIRKRIAKLTSGNAEEANDQDQEAIGSKDSVLAAEKLSSEGWQLWQKQQFADAAPKFEKAIELDPTASNARNGLGWSQIHTQRPKAAAETFRQLLADEPSHAAARNGLGMSLLALGENRAAMEAFVIAVNNEIDSRGEPQAAKMGLSAWFGLVRSLRNLEQYDDARRWADRFLAHNDNPQMKSLRAGIPVGKPKTVDDDASESETESEASDDS